MRKKYISVIALLVTTIGLGGCGFIPTIPDLSEEQEQIITEYAAGLLLKYDSNGSRGLMSDEELAKAAEEEALKKEKDERNKQLAEEYIARTEEANRKKQEEKANKKKDKEDKNKSDSNREEASASGDVTITADGIGQFLGLDGMNVSFYGCETTKSYPGDGTSDLFSVDAADGNKLVVAHINVVNNSSEAMLVDMFEKNYSYQLNVGGVLVENSKTLLLNDFSMYKDTVPAGASVETVLLFEIGDGVDISSASLQCKAGNMTGIITK